MNRLLWKLLRLQISPWQLAGFALANLLGLVVVLFGIQFYSDVAPIFTASDSFMKEEYIVVSKEVGLSGLRGKSASGFTRREIQEISSQAFVDTCAPFVSAQFGVVAAVSSASAGVGFQTEMFLEALPDNFLDINLKGWQVQGSPPAGDTASHSSAPPAETPVVPIVIPRGYLNLYNFGFAAGRGLPALSESMIGMVPIRLLLSGPRGEMIVEGRVKGFSNRLNTILVPMDFLQMANDSLSEKESHNPTRLCIDVKNPADPAIGAFLTQKGYRTEGTGGDAGRMAYFLSIVCFVVVGIGLSICVLAFFVMLLSVWLLLQKNMEKARTLRLIGYPIATICLPYFAVIVGVYLVSFFISALSLSALRNAYLPHIAPLSPDFQLHTDIRIHIIALALSTLLSVIGSWAVWSKMKRST